MENGNHCLSLALSASILLAVMQPSANRLLVDTTRQQVDLLNDLGDTLTTYPVSTSRFGLGFEEGSFKTPTGNFRIAKKIGEEMPAWMSFKGRVATGIIEKSGGDEDLILSRILWLEGLDPENANTLNRYIYFHGTNQEELIGTPASHGCIRLRNLEIIDLFNRVNEGDFVMIR